MTSTYTGAVSPSATLDPRIVPFFEKFYQASDTPAAHDAYVASFLPDADFVMGTKATRGAAGILELRKGLWTGPVLRRKHTLDKIFPFGSAGADAREVMVYGSVEYGLKNGKELTVQWAARALFSEYEGDLRFKLYQVYLDSAPVTNALKDD
ncbi:hypothetical protein PV04_07095 [Phialophora macrospora]|uniref:SnoaL-like domain-containing protein n=1 Tax=Phialophora macrospora TaxID=1851006 RepID=A0A0D2FMI2_9EURO|nr:hypothetical protein PV04_07095 [Phialophora macrospora]